MRKIRVIFYYIHSFQNNHLFLSCSGLPKQYLSHFLLPHLFLSCFFFFHSFSPWLSYQILHSIQSHLLQTYTMWINLLCLISSQFIQMVQPEHLHYLFCQLSFYYLLLDVSWMENTKAQDLQFSLKTLPVFEIIHKKRCQR